MNKECNKCEKHLPATLVYYHKKKGNSDGLLGHCKKCNVKIARGRYLKNEEKTLDTVAKYRKNNKTKISIKAKKYRKDNAIVIKEKHKRYYEENKEALILYARDYHDKNKLELNKKQRNYYKVNKDKLWDTRKEWRNNNKERIYSLNHARRVRESGLVNDFTQDEWDIVLKHFNNKCAYCGEKGKLTRDHFIPVIKGGGHTASNIIPSCLSCNCSKQDSNFIEWYNKSDNYDEAREFSILEYIQK